MRFNKSCLYDFTLKPPRIITKKHNYAYWMIDTVFLRKHFLSFKAFPLPSSVNIHLCFLFSPRKDKLCCCSVAKSCLILCDPMNYSAPGFSVLHYLLGFKYMVTFKSVLHNFNVFHKWETLRLPSRRLHCLLSNI